MTPVNITPTEAKKLVDAGALLVDIREPDEHVREHIPGAKLIPLSRISSGLPHTGNAKAVIFHCRSGGRTQAAIDHLRPVDAEDVYILDGGMLAWKAAGFRPSSTAEADPDHAPSADRGEARWSFSACCSAGWSSRFLRAVRLCRRRAHFRWRHRLPAWPNCSP
ncbi:MAG: rhodanese-like domain-containing protein [Tepidamorphaceae bacterium]